MKKYLYIGLILSVLCLSLTACGRSDEPKANAAIQEFPDETITGSAEESAEKTVAEEPIPDSEKEVVEIKEKMFIEQCDDIYINPEDYENKIIKIEGICDVFTDDEGNTKYSVYRNTPGCCGADGMQGFQISFDGDITFKKGDWIAVTGEIDAYKDEDNYEYVTLVASDVTVKQERGAEFVQM